MLKFNDSEYEESYKEYLKMLENYPNYEEYSELFDEWSYIELSIAYDALYDHQVADQLFEEESPLLVFLIDSAMQDKLILFFEDEAQESKEYD